MCSVARLNRELKQISKNSTENISVGLKDDNILEWEATLIGPTQTPYEGGIFRLRLLFTDDYPFKPPKITFTTRIYHPNINRQGVICLDILKNNWSPALTVSKILLSICSLLSDPNPNDPLDSDIANVYKTNIELFNKNAREWTINFAS